MPAIKEEEPAPVQYEAHKAVVEDTKPPSIVEEDEPDPVPEIVEQEEQEVRIGIDLFGDTAPEAEFISAINSIVQRVVVKGTTEPHPDIYL